MEPTSEGVAELRPAPATFAELYEQRHVSTVRQVALMVGSVAVAEDIAHDAFVQLYRRWDIVDNHGGYLYRCVSNAALRHLRLGSRRGGELVDAPAPVPAIEFVEVAEALSQLTDQQRIATVLKYYGDLTEEQIADAMGCRPGSVGPLLTRARRTLKEHLG